MKLISMHVNDFGGLHNYDYNFEEGLNVVLHDNGWGKTTMAAFLKAMLYGYDAKRSKDITENERKRYLPWQGGKYGGSLDFEADNVRYRIYRTFGETPRFDTARIVNLDTKTTARISPDKIGETLFHLDASAFQRSVFINQNGLSIDGAASSIHTRLNALVSQANDVAAYDGAISSLTQQVKVYEKTGARGQLGAISRQISEKERARDLLVQDITEQDAARARISELDSLLSSINSDLEEKNKRLEAVSGEGKKREAEKKLLEDINRQIAEIKQKIEAINKDLGGRIPSSEEIDQVKRQAQASIDLAKQIKELEEMLSKLTSEYAALLEQYNGSVPQTTQLDRIQSIYGEMQGIKSASGNNVIDTEAPEDYKIIKTAQRDHPEYLDKLQRAIALQSSFQELIRKLELQDQNIQSDAAAWGETVRRYKAVKKDLVRAQASIKEQVSYRPEEVEPVIAKLESLQRKQQTVDDKIESMSAEPLTADQEELLNSNSGELPDPIEGREILRRQREATRRESEIQGLSARLDGEKSKAESIAASLSQLDTAESMNNSVPVAPSKSSGTVMFVSGIVIAIIGAVLGVVVMPVLFALAAVGVILAVFGVVSNNNYKKKLQEYETRQNAAAQNKEAVIRRREDLLKQQESVQSSIETLGKQIADQSSQLQAEKAAVSAWHITWGSDGESVSEAAIVQILEKAEMLRKLREKQDATASSRAYVDNQTEIIKAERKTIDAKYPECAGRSIQEALSYLRAKLSAYKVSDSQLQLAIKNEDQFIEEIRVSRELLESPESPDAANLKAVKNETATVLGQMLEEANVVLALLDLDTDQEHIVQALREAEEMLREFKQYDRKLQDQAERQRKKRHQLEALQHQLNEALAPLSSRYVEMEIPDRLVHVRQEIEEASRLRSKIKDTEAELKQKHNSLALADKAVKIFTDTHGRFTAENADVLSAIFVKVGEHAKLSAAMQQLVKQRLSVGTDRQKTVTEDGSEEAALRLEVEQLKGRRDRLLIEYTQKNDFIRQADKSLERYPDTVQEIHELYQQKQKAQSRLAILKRSIQLITQAKENLANRYLSKVEDLFNSYMHIWLNNDTVKGLLDIDFNITIEENGKAHVAEGYSTGYCDLIDFCMRLALVDTLFESEQPFLILDDPFVNLDADRLEKALELLNVMAANKQIVYFVCHPIRAIETDETSASREEFLKLAEATRQAITGHQASGTTRKKTVRKSPKELYKVSNTSAVVPFSPAKPGYTITNNIFSMNFVPNEHGLSKDNTYELFFIDAVGHVLNDRQIIEVSNGKLSTDRIQFSLNTRDDSGTEFELMIRESGQDDYDVIARIPFRAKLAFTGTFNFDF